jgi:integrase
VPDEIDLRSIRAHHLTASGGLTWHRVQAVQRICNWAVEQQFLDSSPFRGVRKPPLGRRERHLSRDEGRRLLVGADPVAASASPRRPLRWILFAIARMGCRPGEARLLRWGDYDSAARLFAMREYKAKSRRRDHMRARILLVDPTLARVLETWRRRRSPRPEDYVFLNRRGRPWTKDALCEGVARARARAALDVGHHERVVAYSLRHTAATRAAQPLDGSPGATLPQIASWLGHSTTRMTERYVHLDAANMREVAAKAAAARRK